MRTTPPLGEPTAFCDKHPVPEHGLVQARTPCCAGRCSRTPSSCIRRGLDQRCAVVKNFFLPHVPAARSHSPLQSSIIARIVWRSRNIATLVVQGLSADTLLSSAVDEDGVLVRQGCTASVEYGFGLVTLSLTHGAPSARAAQAPGVKTGNSELMESYVKEKVKEVEALDPEM